MDIDNQYHHWDEMWEEEEKFGDDFDEKFPTWMNKDAIIILIDAQAPMFVKNESGEIPFQMSLHCAISLLSDKIISSDSDLLGICFYGTREKRNPNNFENICVFQGIIFSIHFFDF